MNTVNQSWWKERGEGPGEGGEEGDDDDDDDDDDDVWSLKQDVEE